MGGFLYFRPAQVKNVSPEDVATWGLGYAFERSPISCVCHNNTPTGTAGVVFGDDKRHAAGGVKMNLEAQEWSKRPTPQGVYVGYWKESPPTPADLKRQQQLGGFRIQMRDGNEWMCPAVRMFDADSEQLKTALPAKFDLDESGNPVAGDVVAEYASLYELMSDYAAHMQAGTLDAHFESLTMAQLCGDAAKLLQANYTIGLHEIRALNLWQVRGDACSEASTTVLAAIDYPTYSQWELAKQKKTPSLAAADG